MFEILTGFVLLLIGLILILFTRALQTRAKLLFALLLIIKVFVMATVGEVLYSKYIGGSYDGVFYHELAMEMIVSSRGFFGLLNQVDFTIGQSGSNNFAGLIAYFYFFSFSSITASHMFMAAMSVLSLVIGYRAFSIAFPEADGRFFIVPLALLPGSFVFSSLVLKDAPTMLFGVSFLYGLAVFFKQSRLRGAAFMLGSLYLMMLVRVYLGFILIAAVGIGLLPMIVRIRAGFFTPVVRLSGIGFLLLGTVVLGAYVKDVFVDPMAPIDQQSEYYSGPTLSSLETIALWKETVAIQKLANPVHSGLHATGVSITSIRDVTFIPGEMVSVFFRPFLWEIYNLNSFVASMENAFLFIAALKILSSVRRLWKSYGTDPIFLTSVAFVMLFGISFTLVLGNIGTAFRIKVVTYPFFLALFAIAMSSKPIVVPAMRSKAADFRRSIGLTE